MSGPSSSRTIPIPSVREVKKCQNEGLITALTYVHPIPAQPVVRYWDDSRGGAFEEAFPPETFLVAAFEQDVLPSAIVAQRADFERAFATDRPWLNQLQRFCAQRGFKDWVPAKPRLAEALAVESDDLPPTWQQLAKRIERAREEHPVTHPEDVELPRVRGLTAFTDDEPSP